MTKNRYFIVDEEDGMGRCLVLTAPWEDEFTSIIEREDISVLRLSQSAGWKGADISFVRSLTNLRGVEIYSWGIKDITPLQDLRGIEFIGLQCEFTKTPEFSDFKDLKKLTLNWRPKAGSVFSCKGLTILNIENYPSEDLQDLTKMANLQRLQLTSRKLLRLSGIERLRSLRILDLYGCLMLADLSGINEAPMLDYVEIENCRKLYDVAVLGGIERLRRLVLSDCGKIKSLRALSKCRSLEELFFTGDTNIEDGELSPLLELPSLKRMWFADRRHYSHKRDEVASILEG